MKTPINQEHLEYLQRHGIDVLQALKDNDLDLVLEIIDAAIVDDTKLVVTGIEPGATTATIELHDKENSKVRGKQTIAITVRKGGYDNGWM